MSLPQRALLAAFVAGLAVGATLAWWLLPGAMTADQHAASARDGRPAGTIGSEAAARPDGAPRPTLEPRDGGTPRAGAASAAQLLDPEPPGPTAPLPSAVAAWIEVALRESVGEEPVHGTAYALPAGRPGADGLDEICHVELTSGEPACIPVPAEGLYDVGFVWSVGALLQTDVRASNAAPGRVTFALPALAPVRLRATAPLPTVGTSHRLEVRVTLRPAGEGPMRPYPGRRERPQVEITRSLDEAAEGGATLTLPLPRDQRYAVTASVIDQVVLQLEGMGLTMEDDSDTWDALASPDVVDAGGEVRLSWVERAHWKIRVRPEPAAWPGFSGNLTLRWESGGASQDEERALEGAEGLEALAAAGLTRSMHPGRGRLSWSGPGVMPDGLGPIELEPGATVESEITLRRDDGATSRSPDPVPLDLSALPPAARRRRDLAVCGLLPAATSSDDPVLLQRVDWNDAARTLEARWRDVGSVLAVMGSDWVSAPTSMPASGPFRPAFVPGGLLVVVPDLAAPPELGGLTLRHADGLPVFLASANDSHTGPSAAFEVRVGAGTLVGPLPPGPVRFRVRLGSHALGDASADVRAGGVTPLVLRLR